MAKTEKNTVELNRRNSDRRSDDRRKQDSPVAVERRNGATGERRSKVARRRQIDPTTCERDYSGDEIEFMQALDAYKRTSGRMFPTCSEILEVIRSMGYVRVTPSAETIAETAPVADAQPVADAATVIAN